MKDTLVIDMWADGVHPLRHRLIYIAMKTNEEEIVFSHKYELSMLENFWRYMACCPYSKIIGNNINATMHFILVRSMKWNMGVVDVSGKIRDLKDILCFNDNYAMGSLEQYAAFVGYSQQKISIHPWDRKRFWNLKKNIKFRDSALSNVRICWVVLEKLKKMGWIQ